MTNEELEARIKKMEFEVPYGNPSCSSCSRHEEEILRLLQEIQRLRNRKPLEFPAKANIHAAEIPEVNWNKGRDKPVHWHKPYEQCYSDCPPIEGSAYDENYDKCPDCNGTGTIGLMDPSPCTRCR